MKSGSKTFFYSSLFFPKKVRKDVMTLYAFVRIADDYIDKIPQGKKEFYTFKEMWRNYLINGHTKDEVINNFGELYYRAKFKKKWVDDFFLSMTKDIEKKDYLTLDETLKYMKGSAEVVGLMMAKVLNLPKKSYSTAILQGRALQYINIIRDIDEDNKLGRTYIPLSILKKYKLSNLQKETVHKKPEQFISLIRSEINRYKDWQKKADEGFVFIPKKTRIPIKTAVIMYNWTADQIYENPFIIYDKKVKPKISQILIMMLKQNFT